MFRFLRITLILWLLSMALIGGAALYGRTHAEQNPMLAYGLGMCSGKPCFIGITPGVTSWEDVQSLVMRYKHKAGLGLIVSVNNTQFQIIKGCCDSPIRAGTIFSNGISSMYGNNSRLLPLGNALMQYGFPCTVFSYGANRDAGLVGLHYPSMTITINALLRDGSYAITPDSPVIDIALSDISIPCASTKTTDADNIAWMGFVSINRYRAKGLLINGMQ